MYYVGIDVSKYKHDCSILDQSGNTVVDDFVFANSFEGFTSFKILLSSLASPEDIKIGLSYMHAITKIIGITSIFYNLSIICHNV